MRTRQAEYELAQAAAAKDPVALREIIESQADRMPRIARALTRDTNELEDLSQEALAKVSSPSVLLRYRGEGPLDGYLGRVATRAMVSYLRSQGKTWRNTLTVEALPEPAPRDDDGTPLADLDHDVRAAISRLPVRARLVLILIAIEDLSYRDVAETLEMEVGTVKSTYSRARFALRSQLRPQPGQVHESPTARDAG